MGVPRGIGTAVALILASLLLWTYVFKGAAESATVSELWIYPIKSCKGIRVRHAEIDRRGFKYDRNFMVVSGPKNKFISQRTHPRMALIAPEIDSNTKTLIIKAPGVPELRVPLTAPVDPEQLDVLVWSETCVAHEVSAAASAWFSLFLEIPAGCKLVRIADSFKRKTDPSISKVNGETAFADAFPFLLASTTSLAAMNEKMDNPIAMENFRPNIVVKGLTNAFTEDSWKRVQFNKTLCIDVAQPCTRCKLPNNNPETGVMDESFPVTKYLQEYRNGKLLNFNSADEVYFGIHLDNPAKLGPLDGSSISVGQPIRAFM